MPVICQGHEHSISSQNEVGDLEFEWLRTYGPTWRIRGEFGASPATLVRICFELV